MSRGVLTFKKTDVTRAIKAVVNGGLEIQRVVIEGGKIVVFTGKPDVINSSASEPHSSDEWN